MVPAGTRWTESYRVRDSTVDLLLTVVICISVPFPLPLDILAKLDP